MLFNAGKLTEALELFDRLETVSNNPWNKVRALAGKMRCNFRMEKFRNAIDDAAKLTKAEKVTPS